MKDKDKTREYSLNGMGLFTLERGSIPGDLMEVLMADEDVFGILLGTRLHGSFGCGTKENKMEREIIILCWQLRQNSL